MMNGRIRELAEQANVDAGQMFAEMLCSDSEVNVKIAEAWNSQPDEVRRRIFEVIEQNQKKFAELIVKECAKMVADFHKEDEEDEYICHGASEVIKRHFGVE